MSAAVAFLSPPPGLAPHTDFDLAPIDGAEGLFALSARDDAELRLFLVDPRTVVAGYAPVLTDEQVADLALERPDDALLLVVANPGADGVHVNLLAPVVINIATGTAAQLILDGQDHPVRAPLA